MNVGKMAVVVSKMAALKTIKSTVSPNIISDLLPV